MSPELLDPEKFGLKDGRQTKRSDCYALGMVVYEVLSRQVPFFQHYKYAVIARILEGERPGRPRGEERTWFTDNIWDILERCWKPSPGDRPSVNGVLRCLEKASLSWRPTSSQTLPSPPTTNSPKWCSDLSAGESTDNSGVPSPPETVSSRPSQGLPLEGNANEIAPTLLLTDFQLCLMKFRITRTSERM